MFVMSPFFAYCGLAVTGFFSIYLMGIIFGWKKVREFGLVAVALTFCAIVFITIIFEYRELLWLLVFAVPLALIEALTDVRRSYYGAA